MIVLDIYFLGRGEVNWSLGPSRLTVNSPTISIQSQNLLIWYVSYCFHVPLNCNFQPHFLYSSKGLFPTGFCSITALSSEIWLLILCTVQCSLLFLIVSKTYFSLYIVSNSLFFLRSAFLLSFIGQKIVCNICILSIKNFFLSDFLISKFQVRTI